MQEFINIMLDSGKKTMEIAFQILLPIMVIMMALMRLLEKKGLIRMVALLLSPVLFLFGLPGVGAFAILQVLLIGFAGPLSTFSLMEKDLHMEKRRIGATVAMILTMSQANAVFPLAVVGLNLPVVWISSILGGLLSASLTYFIFLKNIEPHDHLQTLPPPAKDSKKESLFQIITQGAEEGLQMVFKAIPLFLISIFLVNLLKYFGFIQLLNNIFTPALSFIGIKGDAILPVLTKFISGGTAMMAVTVDMIKQGLMTSQELNIIAGFMIHPLDLVGFALYSSVGIRTASIMKAAFKGALLGVLLRGIIHIIIFKYFITD
jgi:spore maturation protein SpmB